MHNKLFKIIGLKKSSPQCVWVSGQATHIARQLPPTLNRNQIVSNVLFLYNRFYIVMLIKLQL